MERKIRLSEGDLRRIVGRSVRQALREARKPKPWYDFIATEYPNLTPIDCPYNDEFGEESLICEDGETGKLFM